MCSKLDQPCLASENKKHMTACFTCYVKKQKCSMNYKLRANAQGKVNIKDTAALGPNSKPVAAHGPSSEVVVLGPGSEVVVLGPGSELVVGPGSEPVVLDDATEIVPISAAGSRVKEEDLLEEIADSSGIQEGTPTSQRLHEDGAYWPASKNHCAHLISR